MSEKKNMEFELKRPAAGKKNTTLIYQHLPSGVKKTLRDGEIDTLDPLGSFGWSRYMYIYTLFRFQLFFVSDLICPDNFWDDFPSFSTPQNPPPISFHPCVFVGLFLMFSFKFGTPGSVQLRF